jgi:hypothetical protein
MPTILEELTRTEAPEIRAPRRTVINADVLGVGRRLDQQRIRTIGSLRSAVLDFLRKHPCAYTKAIRAALGGGYSERTFGYVMKRLEREKAISSTGIRFDKRWRIGKGPTTPQIKAALAGKGRHG